MSESQQQSTGTLKAFSLIVTNVTKLAGAVMALNEAFSHGNDLRSSVMMTAALMIAGAQGIESFLDRLFGR